MKRYLLRNKAVLLYGLLIPVCTMLLPILACTRTVSSPQELTQIAESAATYMTPDMTDTPTPTVTPTPTETPVPTDTPAPLPVYTKVVPTATAAAGLRSTMQVEAISEGKPTFDPGAPVLPDTPTPAGTLTPTPTATISYQDLSEANPHVHIYISQNGDTLNAIASRFGCRVEDITSEETSDPDRFLDAGISFLINDHGRTFSSGTRILPDEYVTMGFPSIGYDLHAEVSAANGWLSQYEEYVSSGEKLDGTGIVNKIARDYSVSPILLIELLEFKSHWLYSTPASIVEETYPLGWLGDTHKGLYKQLSWAAQQLSLGYYGWRYGTLDEIPFYKNPKPEDPIYFSPELNAGSVAIQYLFAQLYPYDEFEEAIYGESGFLQQFYLDFGNVWDNYVSDESGINAALNQPELTLPYSEADAWTLTGGPHEAWTTGSPLGALDFAPQMAQSGCAESQSWVSAPAAGLVLRSEPGVVILDLDMDGHEETGWVLMFLHVATKDRVAAGTTVPLHGHIGHPSCEGGTATGTHLHIARKYNGEWINAYGPIPFDMCGWIPFGGTSYKGGLTRGDETIIAHEYGTSESLVRY